ncbi:MAG: two-component regulator propeller domain-containing protein [Bacteroidota bacterium]
MKVTLSIFFYFISFLLFSQTDFSQQWEDFYSYNNVKEFSKNGEIIYAAADNAVFIYDENTFEIKKFSSVHGLSGKASTFIYFSESTQNFIIGYDTGLIEIVDQKGNITIANDIERLDISGNKQINHISEKNDILYLSTPFGIVEYNLNILQFGDTFFIGQGSTPVVVNQTTIYQDRIFAATQSGIFSADVNNQELVDFNNWLQPDGNLLGNFMSISVFNDQLYTSKNNILYQFNSVSVLDQKKTYSDQILNLKSSSDFLTVTNLKKAYILDNSLNQQLIVTTTAKYDFTLHTAFAESDNVYLATKEYGILHRTFSVNNYNEIHPQGPTSNDVFSITAQNNNLWVVYGGYDGAFTPIGKRAGYSHFKGDENVWINTAYDNKFPAIDLVHITIDPIEENKAYISSWNSGILVVENDEPTVLLNDSNSGLEDLYPSGDPNSSIRINGTAFDSQNNFWSTNAWVANRLKKQNTDGSWSSFDLSPIITNQAFGLTELIIDKTNNVWIGSRRNGALVYNEQGNHKKALLTEASKGSLPDPNVRTLAVDRNNRIWIGTKKGMVVFSNTGGLFDSNIYDAVPVIIEDDGIPKKLLGDQPINSIAIDGADNKWFGTDTGGVLNTNASGGETFNNFNKDNSPLASNRILKISIDNSNGKVFFATDKGIVAFNNNVAPYGESLTDVYAYPNPVKKEHETVTIDGRNGTHLPRGTNVKILDTSGKLVFETNVNENQNFNGGKIVWKKTNLNGHKVASGIYIVLLTTPDKSETAMTKIAIIN